MIAWPTEGRPSITSFTSSDASPTVAGRTVTFNVRVGEAWVRISSSRWIFSGGEWSVAQELERQLLVRLAAHDRWQLRRSRMGPQRRCYG